MSDIFHEDFPLEYIQKVFQVMNDCPQHIFQILTKRHQRLAELAGELNWTDNIWMGVSVGENRSVPFIDSLRKVPAKIRFISFEPLIESIEGVNLEGIDWAIIGGESPGLNGMMRPCNIHWIESLVEQCDASDTAVFVKQMGGVLGRKLGMDNPFCGTAIKGAEFEKFPVHLQRREYPIDLE
jgi:protein gp37